MTSLPTIRFATIGLNHDHIYGQTDLLLEAGAELVCFYSAEPELIPPYAARYPQAKCASSIKEILEDETIRLIISARIPCERAPLGIEVMMHGKDYMCDKPGFTTLEQLQTVREVQISTGQIYSVFYAERLANPSTVKAGELVQQGRIGRVIQTTGLGPHQIRLSTRPDWFFRRRQYGGILNDIGSHQIDQFLYFTGSTTAEIVASQVANYHHPDYPEFEDFGDVTLRSDGCSGYFRIDWFTPDGLGVWGDGRLFILGTDGYIELRKICDLAGRPGGNHLFLVNQAGVQYIDCQQVELPYGRQLLTDIAQRTETAMSQKHCFLASELALKAQQRALKAGHLTTLV